MNIKWLSLFICFFFTVVTACSDDKKELNAGTLLVVADEDLSHSAEAARTDFTIPFTAASKWTIEVLDNADWIFPGRSSGEAGQISLKVTLGVNATKNERSGKIRIACGSMTKDISFTQAGKDDGGDPEPEPEKDTMTSDEVTDFEKYYKPAEFSSMNMLKKNAKWSWFRHKQSEHFVVFWEAGFGDNPNAATVSDAMRVDIDDLLAKAETFYALNIGTMKFAEVGNGKSNLDKYKMQIYLHYTDEWMAYGGGYDDVIGGLWINPATCHPVSSTIAHEIGHSFQYQVYADKVAAGTARDYSAGFRYGYGGNGGNGFWEQTAQWQSYQSYPMEAFDSYNFTVYTENSFRQIYHEWQRYASYFIHYYWADKYGIDYIGKIWRESTTPEDPSEAHMRISSLSIDQFNAEMYDAATKFVTWDIDAIRSNGANYIGKQAYRLYTLADGTYQVAYGKCPGTTGYNVIPLNVPAAGTVVTASFKGLDPGSALAADDPGQCQVGETYQTVTKYNKGDASRAGWRYGYVALLKDGKRVYTDMNKDKSKDVSYTVPANCDKLWFVVLGAPTSYKAHPWDEDESNDEQWPYTVKFANTDLLGSFVIDTTKDPKDLTLTYNLSCNVATAGYELGTINLLDNGDIQKLAQAFVLQPSVISGATLNIANGETSNPAEGKIAFGLLQTGGTYNYTYTANGGFYCTAEGNQGSWGNGDPLWVEYNKDTFVITYGQYPNKPVAGTKYTIKPTLVYTKGGVKYKATFVLNMQF